MNDGLLIEEAVETSPWKLLTQAQRDTLLQLFETRDLALGFEGNTMAMMVIFIRPILVFLEASEELMDGWDEAVAWIQKYRMSVPPKPPAYSNDMMASIRAYIRYEHDLNNYKTVKEVEPLINAMGNSWTKEEIADTKYRMQTVARYIGA